MKYMESRVLLGSIAFLESTDYETAVRLAVSLGGDADTMTIIGRNRRLQCRKSPKNRSVTLGRHCDFLFHLFYLYSGSDS